MIEQIPLLWLFACMVNLILGVLCFYVVTYKTNKGENRALGWWAGWWSFFGAFSLMLNATMGTDYYWSYHQTGIISDTAINIGLIIYILRVTKNNWALNDDDWAKINEVRNQAKLREMNK